MSDPFDASAIMPNETAIAQAKAAIETYNSAMPETKRAVTRNFVMYFLPYSVVVAALIAVLLPSLFSPEKDPRAVMLVLLGFGAIYGGLMVWRLVKQPATILRQTTRNRLLPQVLGFVENVSYSNGEPPRFMDRIRVAAVIQHSRVVHDDVIRGRFDGMDFELGECTFWSKGGKSETMTFKGVIFHFPLRNPFPGEMVISKQASQFARVMWGRPRDTHLDPFTPRDSWIREKHSVRSNKADAAARLIDGDLAKVLRWLAETWPKGVARIALKEDDGYLFLPSKENFFELPRLGTPLDYKAHAEPMIHELAMLIATADLVRKAV